MSERLNILFVAPEVAPFAQTSHLGDVAGGLPKALKEMGHDIRVMTPQYRVTNERRYVLRDVIRLHDIEVDLAGEPVKFHVKSAFLPHTKVQVYFLNYRPFYFREGLYADHESGDFYDDNDLRYELLANSAIETLKRLRWQPDIIHCHGWPSAWVPYHLKTSLAGDEFFENTATLLTLYQDSETGPMGAETMKRLGEHFSVKSAGTGLYEMGQAFSDGINIAVNPARPELVDLLPDLSAYNGGEPEKIINGFDGCRWNPESDPFLKSRFSIENFDAKADAKKRLLKSLKLDAMDPENTPVAAVWGRTLEDVQARMDGVKALTEAGWKVLVFVQNSRNLSALGKTPGVTLINDNSEAQLHRLLGGADVAWLVSPEAIDMHLHQAVLRYGAKPLVSFDIQAMVVEPQAGKLLDAAVSPVSAKDVMKWARELMDGFLNKEAWREMAVEAMAVPFSWLIVAEKYMNIYRDCMSSQSK